MCMTGKGPLLSVRAVGPGVGQGKDPLSQDSEGLSMSRTGQGAFYLVSEGSV